MIYEVVICTYLYALAQWLDEAMMRFTHMVFVYLQNSFKFPYKRPSKFQCILHVSALQVYLMI